MKGRVLVLFMMISLFLIPSSFALAEGLLFFNEFSEGDFGVPQNGSVGWITEYEDGGNVSQLDGYMRVEDLNANEQGFRILFTEVTTEDLFVQFRVKADQAGAFGGFGAGNCTTQLGLGIAGTCPEGHQEVWDNSFITWTGSNEVRNYKNADTFCDFTTGDWFDYVVVHNVSIQQSTLWQNGTMCGVAKDVEVGQEMFQFSGLFMQSGGGQIGTYEYDSICAYPASAGSYDLNCSAVPVALTNSTWDVTSGNVIGSTTAWNTGGTVEINTDVLSFTVITSADSNMSCSTTDANYSTMVALEANYKAATTNTTSHATTLFDNLVNGSNEVFCDWVRTDGGAEPARTSALSGPLSVTLSPIIPPTPLPLANIAQLAFIGSFILFLVFLYFGKGGKK